MPAWTAGSLTIHYETAGPEDGPAVLLLAPGGMRSTAERWAQIGFDALSLLPQLGFRAIAMDQRNAGGASTGPIDDDCGWSQYAQDQIALLDQLGIDRCHLLGCCIGGAFILKLFSVAPARFGASVLMQPIGATAENQTVFRELFDGWSAERRETHPEVPAETFAAFRERMFGTDAHREGGGFFSVPDDAVATIKSPLLVLMGDDVYHPERTSRAVVELAPHASLIERWKEPPTRRPAMEAMFEFLEQNPL